MNLAKHIRKHILVVDDSIDHQNLMKTFFEANGYSVECIYNGEEALLLLQSSRLPDLILCDLQMPVMGGREFLEHLSSNNLLKSIPVIVTTATDLMGDEKNIHAQEILKKPLEIDTLMTSIERLLSFASSPVPSRDIFVLPKDFTNS